MDDFEVTVSDEKFISRKERKREGNKNGRYYGMKTCK
jgi:hypothetical protein